MCVHTINTAQIIQMRFTEKCIIMYKYVLVTCELLRHKPCFTTAKNMCYNGPGHILVTRMMFSDETLQSYNLMLKYFHIPHSPLSHSYLLHQLLIADKQNYNDTVQCTLQSHVQ